jgi:hypothetical protein
MERYIDDNKSTSKPSEKAAVPTKEEGHKSSYIKRIFHAKESSKDEKKEKKQHPPKENITDLPDILPERLLSPERPPTVKSTPVEAVRRDEGYLEQEAEYFKKKKFDHKVEKKVAKIGAQQEQTTRPSSTITFLKTTSGHQPTDGAPNNKTDKDSLPVPKEADVDVDDSLPNEEAGGEMQPEEAQESLRQNRSQLRKIVEKLKPGTVKEDMEKLMNLVDDAFPIIDSVLDHAKEAAEAAHHAAETAQQAAEGAHRVAEAASTPLQTATQAVPIVGMVPAAIGLAVEVNKLVSAGIRLLEQQDILEKVKNGAEPDPALVAAIKCSINKDQTAVATGLIDCSLSILNIAGHTVSAGGITAPLGVSMSSFALVGKMAVGCYERGRNRVKAHKANESRKKLNPLHEKYQQGDDNEDRNSQNLIEREPQLAAQVVLNKVLYEGSEAAIKILRSYNIKEKDIEELKSAWDKKDMDAVMEHMRPMRRKMLSAQGLEDETAKTLKKTAKKTVANAKDYFNLPAKKEELDELNMARTLLNMGTRSEFKGMVLRSKKDIKEQRKVLREAFKKVLEEGNHDFDQGTIKSIKELLGLTDSDELPDAEESIDEVTSDESEASELPPEVSAEKQLELAKKALEEFLREKWGKEFKHDIIKEQFNFEIGSVDEQINQFRLAVDELEEDEMIDAEQKQKLLGALPPDDKKLKAMFNERWNKIVGRVDEIDVYLSVEAPKWGDNPSKKIKEAADKFVEATDNVTAAMNQGQYKDAYGYLPSLEKAVNGFEKARTGDGKEASEPPKGSAKAHKDPQLQREKEQWLQRAKKGLAKALKETSNESEIGAINEMLSLETGSVDAQILKLGEQIKELEKAGKIGGEAAKVLLGHLDNRIVVADWMSEEED